MRWVSEAVATALLLCTIVGSGIMAQALTSSVAIQLMINAFATIAVLYVLINAFSELSGAHFNPLVTFVKMAQKEIGVRIGFGYIVAQFLGAIAGTWLAHVMFDRELIEISTIDRLGMHLFVAEVIATFGLVTIATGRWMKVGTRDRSTLIALWIGGAYFFTSSTAFANPAVTVGRIFTESFAGISPQSVLPFVAAQIVGALIALGAISAIEPKRASESGPTVSKE